MATYQYLRVSTTKQEIGRQENEIEKKGFKIDETFIDKLSGKNTERPELQRLKETVKVGDSIICLSIDRFCRNALDFQQLYTFFINKGVRMVFIKEGVDSEGSFSKIILTMSSAFAELEREQITERIQQSADYYKEHGVTTKGKAQWGRARKTADELPKSFTKYYNQMIAGEINKTEMANLLKITRQGLYKWIKLYEGQDVYSKNAEDIKKKRSTSNQEVEQEQEQQQKEAEIKIPKSTDWIKTGKNKINQRIKRKWGINIKDIPVKLQDLKVIESDNSVMYDFRYEGSRYQIEYFKNSEEIEFALVKQ